MSLEPNKRLFYSGSSSLGNGLIADCFSTWTPEFKTFSVVRKITLRDRIYYGLIQPKFFGHNFWPIRCWLASFFVLDYEKSYSLNKMPEWFKVDL
jgi:hypothetical protein